MRLTIVYLCYSIAVLLTLNDISPNVANCLPYPSTVKLSSRSSYPVMENPKLLFGDIRIPGNYKQKQVVFRNAMSYDDWLWPKGIIPIEIDAKLESYRPLIVDALNHYHQHTCLRFKQRTFEVDYVRFIYDEGCYSSIGRIGGQQTISLAEGCYCKGTIIHEVMHALGFWHEQNRSDRDDYIQVLYENIKDGSADQFEKLPANENRLLTAYDYYSIMHYPGNAFARRSDLATMKPKQSGVVLKHACESNALSSLDIAKISKLYKCPI
ncbi:Astacin-like metalloprotease toxin 1 [Halotydeus destructor]|nr:Astacin-like metalloprotease toxin 1 [Halotydeus destructor]